ncbi:hypothetical protein QP868_08225 [Brevibacterium sp. UMB1308A]|uniref:hypothetical protein n=1 Tax=Brevibacterium sp. UMB1308A TaxID=3050608 RepID=UPI00254C44D0|nr:hypothetical protein [Brevibacterium sp. UMB1308A]MDK8345253.1 hypothetical protein [Brevibacterium sp. UMB1308B]MDK8713886.1 hypothetical protein [Brevibacterium sp. UMB1308A]
MAQTYLESLGLLPDWNDTLSLLSQGTLLSVDAPDFTHMAAYVDPSGATFSVYESLDGRFDNSVSVTGPAHVPVDAWQPIPGLAVMNVYEPDGSLFTKVLVWVDDPFMYPVYARDDVGEPEPYPSYCLGAVAADVEVFESVDDWRAQQTPIDASSLADQADGMPSEITLGPTFIASPGLFHFSTGAAELEELSSASIFKAVCVEVEVVTNQLTGKQWYRVVADCGMMVNLALPIDIEPAPRPGSVVDGTAFLTGTTGFWRQ